MYADGKARRRSLAKEHRAITRSAATSHPNGLSNYIAEPTDGRFPYVRQS